MESTFSAAFFWSKLFTISTKNVYNHYLKLFASLFSLARANNSEYDDDKTSDMREGTLAGCQGPIQGTYGMQE